MIFPTTLEFRRAIQVVENTVQEAGLEASDARNGMD